MPLWFPLHRFREVMQANEPEVQEVPGLFRSVLLDVLDNLKEEQEAERLARQWNNRRAMSMSLMNFRSRIKINPFGSTVGLTSAAADGTGLSDLKTVSEDVERGMESEERVQRVWSMPDFRYKGTSSSKVVWSGTDAVPQITADVHFAQSEDKSCHPAHSIYLFIWKRNIKHFIWSSVS